MEYDTPISEIWETLIQSKLAISRSHVLTVSLHTKLETT